MTAAQPGVRDRNLAKVVVLGQGYVGLPLTMRAVEAGYQVVGYDLDRVRIKRLAAAESYVEDVSSESLAAAVSSGRFRPTSDEHELADFDVALIAVPTPLRDGVPDLSHVQAAVSTVAGHLRRGALVVLESTTYPGTTEELVGPLLEEGCGLAVGRDFYLGYSPERVDPGSREWDVANTPKIVAGVDEGSGRAILEFYATIVEHPVPVSSPKVAELAKLTENTFRHVNIALINELAICAHDLGVDVWEVLQAAETKPFGFMRFSPGPGVGGHCLPIDPLFLSWRVNRRVGRRFKFIELADYVNGHMPDYVVRRLVSALNERALPVKGTPILLLGLAYKANIGDIRESPALHVAELLLRLGADVRAADPHVPPFEGLDPRITRVELTAAELVDVDAVVLLTNHDVFDYELIAARAKYVLDCRHRLPSGERVEAL